MPEIVPAEYRVGVGCPCGAHIETYDTRSHVQCCGSCGRSWECVSVPATTVDCMVVCRSSRVAAVLQRMLDWCRLGYR
jgi:hypothetical protein